MPPAGAEFSLVEPDSDQATTQCPRTDLDKTFTQTKDYPILQSREIKVGLRVIFEQCDDSIWYG